MQMYEPMKSTNCSAEAAAGFCKHIMTLAVSVPLSVMRFVDHITNCKWYQIMMKLQAAVILLQLHASAALPVQWLNCR
jgi:hypothetical protein